MNELRNFNYEVRKAHPWYGDPYYRMFWSDNSVYVHQLDTLDDYLNQMHEDIDLMLCKRILHN